MLGGVTDKVDEALLCFVIKVQIIRAGYVVCGEVVDNSGHVVKVSKAPVNGVFDKNVITVVFIELLNKWKAERCIDVRCGGVVPQANVAVDDFSSRGNARGVLSGNFELQKDSRQFFEGRGQGAGYLGSAVVPMCRCVFCESVQRSPVDRLQSLDLSLNGSKGSFDSRFGVFSLRVEIDGLPDGDDCKDDRSDASCKVESVSVHLRSKCDESPNAEFSGERSESAGT